MIEWNLGDPADDNASAALAAAFQAASVPDPETDPKKRFFNQLYEKRRDALRQVERYLESLGLTGDELVAQGYCSEEYKIDDDPAHYVYSWHIKVYKQLSDDDFQEQFHTWFLL